MSEDCEHIWEATDVDESNNPQFRLNRQMSPDPITDARCTKCGTRTWFTEAAWRSLMT